MNVLESFRIALAALRSNKLRALLTMLGIIIGISSVISMQAIGNGFRNYLQAEYGRLGVGVFYIFPSVESSEANQTQTPQLSAADAEALAEPGAVPEIAAVAYEYSDSGNIVSAGRDSYFYTAMGVTPNYFTISEHELGAGRYFTEDENRDRLRVAVIGYNIADTLFGGRANAIGRRITVDGMSFDVIGVLTTQPNAFTSNFFNGPGDSVYLPYQTARARLFRNQVTARQDVSKVTVRTRSPEELNTAIEQAGTLLRYRHRLTYQTNDFRISNPAETARQSEQGIAGLNAFLVIVGGISLLVGGIGIMNIMLVSVTQRTREIGLRKAVGARRRDILLQFLIEALVLCLVGGAIGIAIGFGFSFIGTIVIERIFLLQNARAVVDPSTVIIATAISAAIGIGFGFFPALRAARLDPIRALRHE